MSDLEVSQRVLAKVSHPVAARPRCRSLSSWCLCEFAENLMEIVVSRPVIRYNGTLAADVVVRCNCAASVSIQLSELCQWKEVSTLSSSIYQHMTLLSLEHTRHCSGGEHGSFDNIPGKSRDEQGCRTVRGIDTLHAGLVVLPHMKAGPLFSFFFSHIKILDPTCVSTSQPLLEGGKRKYLEMKRSALTSRERWADTFDRSSLPPPSCERRQMRSKDSHSCSCDMAQ